MPQSTFIVPAVGTQVRIKGPLTPARVVLNALGHDDQGRPDVIVLVDTGADRLAYLVDELEFDRNDRDSTLTLTETPLLKNTSTTRRCPWCEVELPDDDAAVNAHYDRAHHDTAASPDEDLATRIRREFDEALRHFNQQA